MRSRRYAVPPLDPLLAFEAAARHLSFTRAGEELHLTQSAVSRQIQSLEDDLGVRLFERKTRALALTDAGRALLVSTQNALQSLHDTAERLRQSGAAKTVTVTTTPGLAALWLIPRLADFTRHHPGIDVRLSAGHDLVKLERAGVDLAIRYGPEDAARGHDRLLGETVFPVCAPQLVDDAEHPLRVPADLAGQVLLHLDDAGSPWLDWDLWIRALGLEALVPAGHLRFGHYDQVIHAAVAGQGVALGRDPLVRALMDEGRLVAPFPQDRVSSRGYYLVRSAVTRDTPHVRAFADWLLAVSQSERQAAFPPGGNSRK